MNSFILTTILFLSSFDFSHADDTTSIDSSSEQLEARFKCSEFSVLAEEINRREKSRRQADHPFCSTYNEIIKSIIVNDDDVEHFIQNSRFVDSGVSPPSSIENACESLNKNSQELFGGKKVATFFEHNKETPFLTCPTTRYECKLDEDLFRQSGLSLLLPTFRTVVKALNSVKGVDHDCLRDVIDSVVNFSESFNQQMAIDNICLEQTVSLEENEQIVAAFLEIEVETKTRLGTDGATTIEFVEYLVDASTTTSYEQQCFSNGGTYSEVNLLAVCRGWTKEGVSQEERTELVVARRPRCYGIDCTDSDDSGLFEEFTLRETERKWEKQMPGSFWVCKGQSVVDADEDFSICSEETGEIGKVDVLRSTNNAIQPDVKQKKGKFLFLFPVDLKGESIVEFSNTAVAATEAYENACVDNGGDFSVANAFVVKCEQRRVGDDDTRVRESFQFDVSGFPMCLSASCIEANERESREESLILEKLKQEGLLGSSVEFEWTCKHTSGVSWLAVAPMAVSLVAVLSAMLFC